MRLFDLIGIGLKTPPRDTCRWLLRHIKARRAAKQLPAWERWLGGRSLAGSMGQRDLASALRLLDTSNPFPGLKDKARVRATVSEEAHRRLKERAQKAMRLEVDFLGSGPIKLRRPIDWTVDFKSGTRWSMSASRRLPVNELDRPSDIKVPWELSRLQWLLPVAQLHVLDGERSTAAFTRDIIDDWIAANPVCRGPNWICAMDVALRAVSMLWIFYACREAEPWRDTSFRERFLKSLVLHGRFIELNLEFADVNGNHLAADLCGLALIGMALGGEGIAERWVDKSWSLLCEQLPEQVPDDGVCREASLPYHRLVAELFALPALGRIATGRRVDDAYKERLAAMADFTYAATRPGGEVPVWGDADDGRALPLGTQAMNDHRYLGDLLCRLERADHAHTYDETLWWRGVGSGTNETKRTHRKAFPHAGVYILGDGDDHVFVDAGPVGMRGRGGHGHNDCLSFEASLAGTRLIVDPGSYLYTADMNARNKFRSTHAHNTPEIDQAEINRFISPRALWRLHDDAQPTIRTWRTTDTADVLIASHSGYTRLASPVTPVRTFLLDKSTHRLVITDRFEGDGPHAVRTKFTFAPDLTIEEISADTLRLTGKNDCFLMVCIGSGIERTLAAARISPAYGILQETTAVTFSSHGDPGERQIVLLPEATAPSDLIGWLHDFREILTDT